MLENVEVLCHSSIKINKEKVIYIDPFKIDKNYNDADIIFITHDHYDHYSEDDIDKVINENCKTVMLTWKSVAPDICDMLFSMPPNMFAFGVLHSRPILKRSVLRESITMLPSLMLLKSW